MQERVILGPRWGNLSLGMIFLFLLIISVVADINIFDREMRYGRDLNKEVSTRSLLL